MKILLLYIRMQSDIRENLQNNLNMDPLIIF